MEATVVCVDNSESTRNGDFEPNRFQAQVEAINLLAGAKTGANPENTIGVLTCATVAGKAPKVMVTPTPDLGKVLNAMADIGIGGSVELCKSAQIAQLALKHRQNKRQFQRVVIFVGSPVTEEKELLVKVGKKLKKNNVSVDVVSFGASAEENKEKLEALVAAVNKDENSHFVEVPAGSNLADFLLSSPVVSQVSAGETSGGAGGSGGTGGFEFGVDPNLDPELALALRMSMEDERARQAAAERAAAASAPSATAAQASTANAGAAVAPATADAATLHGDDGATPMEEDDADALLQQALAISMQENEPEAEAAAAGTETGTAGAERAAAGNGGAELGEEDADMAAALAMSLEENEPGTSSAEAITQSMQSLPGVDINSPEVQAAIAEASRALDKRDQDDKSDTT